MLKTTDDIKVNGRMNTMQTICRESSSSPWSQEWTGERRRARSDGWYAEMSPSLKSKVGPRRLTLPSPDEAGSDAQEAPAHNEEPWTRETIVRNPTMEGESSLVQTIAVYMLVSSLIWLPGLAMKYTTVPSIPEILNGEIEVTTGNHKDPTHIPTVILALVWIGTSLCSLLDFRIATIFLSVFGLVIEALFAPMWITNTSSALLMGLCRGIAAQVCHGEGQRLFSRGGDAAGSPKAINMWKYIALGLVICDSFLPSLALVSKSATAPYFAAAMGLIMVVTFFLTKHSDRETREAEGLLFTVLFDVMPTVVVLGFVIFASIATLTGIDILMVLMVVLTGKGTYFGFVLGLTVNSILQLTSVPLTEKVAKEESLV